MSADSSIPANLPLPLEGIRVLDATHIVAGPFCSLILADMGAEVIKIERPRTGDLARGRGPFIGDADSGRISSRFLGVNRNKKSVTLDLRNATCKAAFESLVANSDVLLDNWGPGAFRRLGLGYDRLREINPRLIYAEITGYGDAEGARGPYSDWPANNLAIQAMSGWMDLTGAPGGTPQAVGDNIGDSVPGVWAALGIVLALETRRQTGVGQHVDVAMYECMASHVISNMNAYQATGATPGRTRQASLSPGLALRASDGHVVMAGVRTPQRLAGLWKLIGRTDLPGRGRALPTAVPRRRFRLRRDDTGHRGMVFPTSQVGSCRPPDRAGFLHGRGPERRRPRRLPAIAGPGNVRRHRRHPGRNVPLPGHAHPTHLLPPAGRRNAAPNWASTTPRSCAPWAACRPQSCTGSRRKERYNNPIEVKTWTAWKNAMRK